MCTDRASLRRALFLGAVVSLVVACAENEPATTPVTDAGALPDATTKPEAADASAAVDAAAPPICKEGRRRCDGSDLEVCDNGAWVLLQSCLAGEWCDVAVGICRAVDAGPDSAAPDAS